MFPAGLNSNYVDLDALSINPDELIDIVAGFLVRLDRRLSKIIVIKICL